VGDYCRKMKSTIGLHDLGVHGPGARPSSQRSAGPSQQLRGRADAAHAPAVNTHLPLQVRDALTLELTRPPPHTHLPRLRLQPRPPPLAHSSLPHHRPSPRCPPLSLVLLPPGRTGVDGAVGAAEDAVGGRGTPTQAPTPPLAPLPGGTPWPNFSNPWSWRISMWPHRVREGGLVPCTSLRPWSRVPPPTR
jgi:hypothetical protein